jgi:hypothetical protein
MGVDGGEVEVKDGWEEWSRRDARTDCAGTWARLPPVTNNGMGLSRI